MKRDFDSAAKTWDQDEARMRMSTAVADAMVASLTLSGSETVLDYGTGTGAVAFRFVPLVKRVLAADSSRGMLEVLAGKIATAGVANLEPVFLDLEQNPEPPTEIRPDVVVSAMALHHIADTARFAQSLAQILPPGGRIALADLDSEAGDFHADNTGVHHFGFNRDHLAGLFKDAGFLDIHFRTTYDFVRPTPGGEKTFPIFLLLARRG
jgi:cyclopropane fatty-acyl-phospholipid synthase-like methyltransferase